MRKPDPERIYLARRSATFRRFVDEEHVDELDAEHWIAGWEREADARGIDRHSEAFWQEAMTPVAVARPGRPEPGLWATRGAGAG